MNTLLASARRVVAEFKWANYKGTTRTQQFAVEDLEDELRKLGESNPPPSGATPPARTDGE